MAKRTVKVYRLEDAEGQGVFRGRVMGTDNSYVELLHPEFGEPGFEDNRHIVPTKDGLLKQSFRGGMVFGFATVKQFRHWFFKKEWRLKLTLMGIKLNVYEVPVEQLAKGATQVAFYREQAKLVESKAPMYRDTSMPKRIGDLSLI